MSRNRYVGDYHLADSLDERGRIRTEVEYVGEMFSFAGTAEQVRRAGRRAAVLCAAGWLLYAVALLFPSRAARTLWTAVPFVFTAVPLAMLSGIVPEVLRLKERFEHRYADRIENRWPAAAVFTAVLSGLALGGEAVNLIRGAGLLPGDGAFAACAAGLLAVGLFAFRSGRELKCGKVS